MPMYRYEVVRDDGEEGEIFEIMQSFEEPALKKHPETGEKVRRLISAPNVTLRGHTERAQNNLIKDNKKLEQMGFTKYERNGKGVYERKAGKEGPKIINAND